MIPVEGGGSIRCPIPQNGMMNNRNLPMDMNKSRYEKPVQTPSWGAKVANPDCITFEHRIKTTAAEVRWKFADKEEASRCQEPAVAAEGAGTGGTTNEGVGRWIVIKGVRLFGHYQRTVMSLWNRCPAGCRQL